MASLPCHPALCLCDVERDIFLVMINLVIKSSICDDIADCSDQNDKVDCSHQCGDGSDLHDSCGRLNTKGMCSVIHCRCLNKQCVSLGKDYSISMQHPSSHT